MSTNWKPGDVAVGRLGHYAGRFIFRGELDGWDEIDGEDGGWDGDFIEGLRPLVVIDPEDREQVERLDAAYKNALDTLPDYEGVVEVMQAALREFANPTPPKPDEPTGLGAVVEDAEGYQWVRAHGCWYRDNAWAGDADYADIDAVRVLSEGVQP